jgi:hypothetical protein
MTSKDYLPKAYHLLLTWLINFMGYLIPNISRFGITSAKVTPIQTQVTQFQTAQAKAELPNAGSADRLVRKERAAAISKAIRIFVNANLRYNELVTDEDRKLLGLTIPDDEPTPETEPATIPVVDFIDTTLLRRIILHIKDMNGKSRAKPRGVHGVEIVWAILDASPSSIDDLIHSTFSTRLHHPFDFDENRRGKIVWFCLRWENNRGQKGPWSEIYSAIVP